MGRHHDKRFPGEDAAYRDARDRLLDAELDLRRQVEAVAALRRALPSGGRLKADYVFRERSASGMERDVRFADLFRRGSDTLILYNYMFGPDRERPCPMCTSIIDGWEGNAAYVNERVSMVVVAKAPAERLRAWGDGRGWHRLRLVSSGATSFNADYNAEFASANGDQHPMLHVFVRHDDGIRHFWSSELLFVASDGQPRHIDQMWPLWNLLDLTPEGRGTDWYPNYQK